MSVNAYVWLPHGYSATEVWRGDPRAVGHASVEVRGSAGNIYISWWPNDADRATTSGKIRSGLWGVTASNHRNVHIDTVEEGGRIPISTDLTGLNELDICNWWKSATKTYWSLLNTNCSQMAADALRAGGADKFIAGNGFSRYYISHSVVWRPSVFLDYVRSIRSGILQQ